MTVRKMKIEKLFNALKVGRQFTTRQLENRTGLQNVSAAINSLRNEGVKIVTTFDGERETYRRVA